MSRNRIIYQTESLFVGPSPATGFHFLSGDGTRVNGPLPMATNLTKWTGLVHEVKRVQNANYSFNIPKTDVNQFGELAAIDRIVLEQPTVSLDFSYLLANFSNEVRLGFDVMASGTAGAELSSCISGILNKVADEKNYFIRTVPEGNDVVNYQIPAVNDSVIGIGNAFLTSYTTEGSVGNFPTASVSLEALNITVDTGVVGRFVPAVNPVDGSVPNITYYALPTGVQSWDGSTVNATAYATSALRPGDITLLLNHATSGAAGEFGPDYTDLKLQNYSLSFDLNREPLQKLGSKYAFSREITFPVTVTLQVTADVGDSILGNLAAVIDRNSTYNPTVTIKRPGDPNTIMMLYKLAGAKLDSMEYTSSIGPNKSVSMTFSSQLGGPQATTVGLFMSGVYYPIPQPPLV